MANAGTTTIGFMIAAQNQAIGGGNGGAIANQNGGTLTIGPVGIVQGNQAANGGGAINNQFGATLKVDRVAFRGEHGDEPGRGDLERRGRELYALRVQRESIEWADCERGGGRGDLQPESARASSGGELHVQRKQCAVWVWRWNRE